MKLISGSSNIPLAKSLGEILKLPLVDSEIDNFANGEKRVWVKEEVGGENVTVVQSFSDPVDTNIIETILINDALERLGARNINVIIPWLGYSLQDKVFRQGEPIAAKVIANLISNSHVARVMVLDLHNPSTAGFFSVPTEHLSALDLFANHIKENFDLNNAVVASPDFGGLKRARVFAKTLGVELTNIDKSRDLHSGKVTAEKLHGSVKDKDVLIFDDSIVSGGTVVESARILKENGAKSVHFLATHGLFAKNAIERIHNSQIDKVIITNSIHHPNLNDKISVLDAAPIFAKALSLWQ